MLNDRQRQDVRPVSVKRTKRVHDLTILTSLQAGKMMPVAAIPLLREDAVTRGQFSATFEMHETEEVLMNPVHMTVSAYLFPFLASPRFEGSMDQFNRSYAGQPKVEGGEVEPWVELMEVPAGGSSEVDLWRYLGLHASAGDQVSSFYNEAYVGIWNFRAKNRSPDIELMETTTLGDLLPAFWPSSRFSHIVPDFDQAKMEGAIPITLLDNKMPVRNRNGEAHVDISSYDTGMFLALEGDDVRAWEYNTTSGLNYGGGNKSPAGHVKGVGGLKVELANMYAELQDQGISLSLANIEVAKKTRAYATIRERYSGHDDDWIIDMLMSGLSIPDQAYKQPIFLGQQHTTFQFGKRYSTDADNLDAHVVNGVARVNMTLRTPRIPTGGVIMIVAEVVPEQLFERQQDPLFHLEKADHLPQHMRDDMDPEKVVVVPNDYIDTDHEQPDGLFGYAPLNHQWTSFGPRIGGRFYRPDVDAPEDTDRKRLWAVETKNPKLAENFYIVSDIHTKPFLHPDEDPVDAVVLGGLSIEGNTVFGGALIEASDDYDRVMEQVPQNRIEKA